MRHRLNTGRASTVYRTAVRSSLAATLLVATMTGCCLSETSVQALEARVDADNGAAERQAMAKARADSHVTEANPRLVGFVWHTPRVPETATNWLDVPSASQPVASDEVVLKAEHEADLLTTWGAWTGNPLIDARTAEGAPVLLVLASPGVRFGQTDDGRLVRFMPSPLSKVRDVHSCGTCRDPMFGGGMPDPFQPIVRGAALYVFEGRTSSEMRTIWVQFDATRLFIRCDHEIRPAE